MNRRAFAAVVLAVAILVVASAVPAGVGVASAASEHSNGPPPDPDGDVVGWENGYWHNESIDVDQSDGLTDAELDAFVSRATARVEFLRGREFTENVSVAVISRSEYRNRTANRTANATFAAWNNQVWEALFIVGEDADVQEELGTVSGTSVAGFYSFADNEIKIITETPDRPVINNATLVHELVHALQDQHYNFTGPAYHRETQDGQLALDGLIEGDANYVENRYAARCGVEWTCVGTPSQPRSGGDPRINFGVFLTVFHPYSDGPSYVNALVGRDGWATVDAAYDDPPTSTEQIIHLTDDEPDPIGFEDGATNGWEPFPEQGENGSDTAGEASMYAMFWYQAREYRADTVSVRSVIETDDEFEVYNYAAGPSSGWGNDRVFPYRTGAGNDTEFGYVWLTEWDTPADAEQFRTIYLRILDAHDARRVGEHTWVIDDGPYADAFRVVLNDTRVTVVNGPTVDDLDDIRPGIADPPVERTETTTRTRSPPVTTRAGPDETPPDAGTITPGQPGFGVVAALLALAAAALARRRR